jgi:iron complex outermembrane receptor protein
LHDRVAQVTRHFGLNYQAIRNRLLVFANTSTAFEPSTRVDARTGRIQGNETTLGYEAGMKGLFLNRKITATLLLFRFYNQNISRRNPLYDDPIADANQTQPQLVAAGEERFTGATLDLKAQITPTWSFTGRYTYTEAITTRSPDLPEEIGRPLTRLPRTTLGMSTRYAFTRPALKGLWVSGSANYVGSYVAYYESASRAYLAYPGYTLLGVNTGYSWKVKKTVTHNVGLGLRNALDRDLLATYARPGAGRELVANYTLLF